MNTYIFRFNKPVKYGDMAVEDYQERIKDLFVSQDYVDVVMVREMGEEGTNLHWHGRFSTRRNIGAVRKDLNNHFDMYGNEEFSLKCWDPTKADKYHRYLAKGPVTQRLVMPIVVIDDLGLLWERLHHSFHDEMVSQAARTRSGKGGDKKSSFTDEFIALCRSNGSKTKGDIWETLKQMLGRRVHTIDSFVVDKLLWTAYVQVNPVEGFDSLKGTLRFFQ